jgi:triosephosphate isomerase
MRNFLVVANWKMNGSKQIVSSLLQELLPLLADINNRVECVICPPSIYIPLCSELADKRLVLGAQNVVSAVLPAFTGELSPAMLREFDCKYVIIGHSERRAMLQETDMLIADKVHIAINGSLQPILCVGETKSQQESGLGVQVVLQQLDVVIKKIGIANFQNVVIAYEPVWAIGTGLSATPQQAQAMHAAIRAHLSALDSEIAARTKIIYGGSMNAANASELLQQPDIDGGLIGGASLKARDFSEICHAAMRMAE